MPETVPAAINRVPMRLILLAFLPIFAILAGAYYLFVRPDFVQVFAGLRAQQTAAIAKELSGKNIAYRLTADSSAIEVPRDMADEARLAIASSDAGPGTTTGFELFNKSDMGLTDFAQKINYQRALQGELERTILGIDGIETARVHLALPERSLFRSVRSPAKAAVEIGTKSGIALDSGRVASLQHLVASAVSDLEAGDVTVVDATGRLLSVNPDADPDAMAAPETEEHRALQHLMRARLRSALQAAIPDLRFDVKILSLPAKAPPAPDAAATTGADSAEKRGYGLRATVVTPYPLDGDQQIRIEDIARSAIGFSAANGDSLSFETGAIAAPAVPQDQPASAPPTLSTESSQTSPSTSWLVPGLLVALALAIAAAGLTAIRWRRSRKSYPEDYHADLAQRLRQALAHREVTHGE